ncbi:SLATT domain-containing protein [Acidithiobacillus ferrivorans]|nr:SLATT domain-containing protein [Acidithiobacillus ferrivorans]
MEYKPISDKAAGVFGIVLSVTLFGLSFYMNTRGFSARAHHFKENYTRLQELLGLLEVAECQADSAKLQKVIENVQAEYGTAIANSENHTTMDDRCARFPYGRKGTSRTLTNWDYIYIWYYFISRYLSLGLLYASPVLIYSYMIFVMN